MHGGVAKDNLTAENAKAVKKGCENLGQHSRNLGNFGVPVAVGMNRFTADTEPELDVVRKYCDEFGVEAHDYRHWAKGGRGTTDRARHVVELAESGKA